MNSAIDSPLYNNTINIDNIRTNRNNRYRERQRRGQHLNSSLVSPPNTRGGHNESLLSDGTRHLPFDNHSLQDEVEDCKQGDSIHQWSDWIRTRSTPRQPQIHNNRSMRSSSASCERLAGRGQHVNNGNVTTHDLQSGLLVSTAEPKTRTSVTDGLTLHSKFINGGKGPNREGVTNERIRSTSAHEVGNRDVTSANRTTRRSTNRNDSRRYRSRSSRRSRSARNARQYTPDDNTNNNYSARNARQYTPKDNINNNYGARNARLNQHNPEPNMSSDNKDNFDTNIGNNNNIDSGSTRNADTNHNDNIHHGSNTLRNNYNTFKNKQFHTDGNIRNDRDMFTTNNTKSNSHITKYNLRSNTNKASETFTTDPYEDPNSTSHKKRRLLTSTTEQS